MLQNKDLKPSPLNTTTSWIPKTFLYPITMINRTELFIPPPHGLAGVVVCWEKPDCNIGDRIIFTLQGEEIAEGVVTYLESPATCIRPISQRKVDGKWKLHWFPIKVTATTEINATLCPKCNRRSGVYNTLKSENKIIRYRRCAKCKIRWLTTESFAEILTSKVKNHEKSPIRS